MHGHTALHSHTCVDNCKNVAVPKLPPLLRSYGRRGGQQQSLCSTSSPLHPGCCFYGQLRLLFHLKRFSPTLYPSSQVRVRGCPCSSFHQKEERDSRPADQPLLWGHKIAAHKAPSILACMYALSAVPGQDPGSIWMNFHVGSNC